MKSIRGTLLDVDGTLLDSNMAHALAWRDALVEQGIAVQTETLEGLVGMGADELLPKLGLSDGEDPGKTAKERSGTIFREKYLPGLRPQRGARQLLALLRERGIARVVATSSNKDEIKLLLKAAGIQDLVEDTATASDASRSKPNPDIVEAAIERAGLPKECLVMLGDTPYDVTAAARAGIAVICVRCGGWDDEALKGAAEIYDDPADIVACFERSMLSR
ncbi:MAG: HAD family hydrolase [Myxococcota bacterium]|nr:HAD family hydrolase [Myxococcota bacterium]